MSRLTRDGTAEPVSRDQIPGANADREIFIFLLQVTTSRILAQPYPVDPYSCYMCVYSNSVIYLYTLNVYSIVCCLKKNLNCCYPNERRAAAERSESFSETLRVQYREDGVGRRRKSGPIASRATSWRLA